MNMNEPADEIPNEKYEIELNDKITLLCFPDDNGQQEEFRNIGQTQGFD